MSNAEDLAKFGNALLTCYQPQSASAPNIASCPTPDSVKLHNVGDTKSHGCILESATISMMWTPVVSPYKSEPHVSYAMGWLVREGSTGIVGGKDQPFYAAHSGGTVGASSILVVMPSRKSTPNSILSESKLTENLSLCSNQLQDVDECDYVSKRVPRGVVVAVLFNLQEVNGVFSLGVQIAEEFLKNINE